MELMSFECNNIKVVRKKNDFLQDIGSMTYNSISKTLNISVILGVSKKKRKSSLYTQWLLFLLRVRTYSSCTV